MQLPEPLARGLRRASWLAGLPALALIWVGTTLSAVPGIAARIEAEGAPVAAATATATGEPWLRLTAQGRDLRAAGEAPDVGERETALARLALLEGPRRIVSEVGLVETASPFVWAAVRTGATGIALEGSRPVEIGRRALEARVADASAAGTRLDDSARAARGAPAGFPDAAAFLAARLAGLGKGGRAGLSDTVLNLSGEALDVPAYDGLRAALADPPAGYAIGRIEILPPLVQDFRFSLEKSAGGIVLAGYVPSEAIRDAARNAATEQAAGGSVEDRLHTARGLDAAIDPGDLVAFIVRMADLIQAGRVAFADGAVSVAGDAIDGQAIPEAAMLMREGRPAGVAAGAATLAERPLTPYRMAIRRSPEGVTLTGHLPDAAARERVLAALRPRLFREPLADRTRLAEGAPPDLAAALSAAIPMLASLASGEVAVSDRALRLTGESLYREAAARAPERLAAALPAGWSGSAAVAPRDAPERRGPESCRETFSAAVAGADLRFPAGSASLTPGFYPTLDALAALARACPSLRIAVSGPADPAKPKAAAAQAATTPAGGDRTADAKPAGEATAAPTRPASAAADAAPAGPRTAVPTTASLKAVQPKTTELKNTEARKADPRKPEASRKPEPSKTTEPVRKPEAPEEPPVDLPRQRALALVEYLLQAGMRPDQVSAGPDGPGGRVAFALIP